MSLIGMNLRTLSNLLRERRSQAAGGHRIYHVNEGSSIDSFRETNGAAVHDIRRTLPLLTLNNDGITKVFLQLLLRRYVV
jgi:hypothetical protein